VLPLLSTCYSTSPTVYTSLLCCFSGCFFVFIFLLLPSTSTDGIASCLFVFFAATFLPAPLPINRARPCSTIFNGEHGSRPAEPAAGRPLPLYTPAPSVVPPAAPLDVLPPYPGAPLSERQEFRQRERHVYEAARNPSLFRIRSASRRVRGEHEDLRRLLVQAHGQHERATRAHIAAIRAWLTASRALRATDALGAPPRPAGVPDGAIAYAMDFANRTRRDAFRVLKKTLLSREIAHDYFYKVEAAVAESKAEIEWMLQGTPFADVLSPAYVEPSAQWIHNNL